MRRAGWSVLLGVLLVGQPAWSWTDARPAGMVTELAVDRDGGATVTLRIRWRVLAGHFRAFELDELPADLTILEASATDATGNPVTIATRVPAPARLEVTLGDASGLRRGAIDVVLRYTTSLRAQGAIHRHGDDAVVDVTTLPWERGLEAAEIRIALPASERRAQWIADETPGVDATVASELGRDVAHAIRRHLPAGERWTGHVACDPGLFAWLDRPVGPRVSARVAWQRPVAPTFIASALVAAALALAIVALRAASRGAALFAPRWGSTAIPAMLGVVGGVAQVCWLFELHGSVALGTLAILAAFGLCARVPHDGTSAPRAHATLWPDARVEALATPRRRRAAPGVLSALGWVSALACAAFAWSRHRPGFSIAAIDLALFALGSLVALRDPRAAADAVLLRRALAPVYRVLQRDRSARLVWRVRGDGTARGAVSLRILPRPGHRYVRGVRAIECSVAWSAGTLRWRAIPEIAVRVDRGSRLERTLRETAVHVGHVTDRGDDETLTWSGTLLATERSGVCDALQRVLAEAISVAPTANAGQPGVRPAETARARA